MEIKVKYYKTLKRDEVTGFAVFTASPIAYCEKAKNGVITCAGIIPFYNKGTPIELTGSFDNDIFKVENCKILSRTKANEALLISYVCDDLTDGQVEKIINISGGDILKELKNNPKELEENINKIIKKKKNSRIITRSLIANLNLLLSSEALTRKLLSVGVPMDKIGALVRKKISYNQIMSCPYYFFVKFDIDIALADKIYSQMVDIKEKEYNFARICGFVYSAIKKHLDNGNTCITLNELTNATQFWINYKGVIKTKVCAPLINTCVIGMEEIMSYKVIDGMAYIYLNSVWDEESVILENIKRINATKVTFNEDVDIDSIESELRIKYNKSQRDAFGMLKTSGIKILTGAPGTGKTAILNGIIKALIKEGRSNISLAATTGMAAKIMAGATNRETQTVNKMLNAIPYDNGLLVRDEATRLESDVVIVDEISMLGLQLGSVLFSAIKSGATLILVGDEDQLGSVDYGNILSDLIKSGLIEVYRLTEIMRQKGSICTNAGLVNQHNPSLTNDDSFRSFECTYDTEALNLFKKYYKSGTQVLCPIKNGSLSVTTFNDLIQNKNKPIVLKYGSKEIREDDKVVITKTNYDYGFINGDVGYAKGADDNGLYIKIGEELVMVPRDYYSYIELAYALTIHKSQGSEYENVIVVLPSSSKNMLITKLLYTAITRAKKRVIIISQDDAMKSAILNIYSKDRETKLAKRLSMIQV